MWRWFVVLTLISISALAYDYEVKQTFHNYSSNLFVNATELGQGTATAAVGQGLRGVMTNPAALAWGDLWEFCFDGGTMLNYRAGGTALIGWHGILLGYGTMRPTVPEARIVTDRLESYIQSNYAAASDMAFLGYGISPWDWINLGIKVNSLTNLLRVASMANQQANPLADVLDYHITSYTGDAGLQLHFDWFNAGIVLRNYGLKKTQAKNLWDDTGTFQTHQVVGVYPIPVNSLGLSLTSVHNLILSIQVDQSDYQDGIPWAYKAGAELRLNSWFSGRFGYDSEFGNESGGGVCLGTGMKLGSYLFDLALVDGTRLNTSQRYSFSALASLCYYIPYTTNSPHRVIYSHKYYDEKTLELIKLLKSKTLEYEEKGDLQNALDTLDTLIAWNPDDYEAVTKYKELTEKLNSEEAYAHLTQANEYLKKGNYTDAVMEGQEAHKLTPDDSYINEFLGEAQRKLEEAQNTRKKEIANLLYEADSNYTSGDFAIASNKYRDVLRIEPGNIEAQSGVDKSLVKMGEIAAQKMVKAKLAESAKKYDEAIANYQAVLDINPDNVEAKAGLGICRKAKDDRIRTLLDTAIDYFEQGNYDAAESRFRAVLSLDNENNTARNYLANIRSSQTKGTEPSNTSKSSHDFSSIYQLGVTAYTARDYATAIAYWDQIPEGDTYYRNAQINIARAQAILQEFNR